MSIPRRIIQTHRSPDIGREWRESWIAHNPGYEYMFFTNDECRDFVAQHRPGLLPIYDKLPNFVQRVDLFRYLVVHELGGFYADVDTVCCAPLDSYVDLERDHLVGGMEMTLAHYRHELRNQRIPQKAHHRQRQLKRPQSVWFLRSPGF